MILEILSWNLSQSCHVNSVNKEGQKIEIYTTCKNMWRGLHIWYEHMMKSVSEKFWEVGTNLQCY